MATSTVVPRCTAMSRRIAAIELAVVESSSPVGSSANNTLGPATRALAMDARCCSPRRAHRGGAGPGIEVPQV